MNLRTVTIGVPRNCSTRLDDLHIRLKDFRDSMSGACAKYDCSIRTFRINLPPLNNSGRLNEQVLIGQVEAVSKLCNRLDIRWFNVPFHLTDCDEHDTQLLIEVALHTIKRFPKTFVNLVVASDNQINYNAITYASKFIKRVSQLDNSGYHNFRVGVSCNVQPNTPFFPFTYSSDELGFSIGLEMPQACMAVLNGNVRGLTPLRQHLINLLLPQIKEVEFIATKVAKSSKLKFHGIDLSLAPYPEKSGSVAQLMEMLGLEQQGSNGTLFLTSYVTDILRAIIKKGSIRTAGFCGVMFSLLEDEFMGKRNNNNIYSLDSLISYSAVCGCGLDMVPLPGDIFEEELASVVLDVAALSTALQKPLGVRVLPIPMKGENEFTEFNMDFLYNTRIKKIKNMAFLNTDLNQRLFNYITHRN